MSKIFPKCGIGTKLRYKKIQKDMIFVPMPNRISIRHNKKADRCLRSAYKLHMDAIKKAGLHYCRSTHLGSGIAFVTNSNTVAHAVYLIIMNDAYAYAHNNIHL